MKTFTIEQHSNHKHSTQWAKVVTSVDVNQKNGYAFGGQFVTVGQEQEAKIGSVILYVVNLGSRKNGSDVAFVYVLTETGLIEKGNFEYRNEFVALRSLINSLV
jgi:hypothetical protein